MGSCLEVAGVHSLTPLPSQQMIPVFSEKISAYSCFPASSLFCSSILVLIDAHLFTRMLRERVETEERREIVVHQERLEPMEPQVSPE